MIIRVHRNRRKIAERTCQLGAVTKTCFSKTNFVSATDCESKARKAREKVPPNRMGTEVKKRKNWKTIRFVLTAATGRR